jgi:L-fuculose-phosphate aldolase
VCGQGELGIRREVVRICARMYERGYIVAADGNVSVRVGADRILVTPSGAHKGTLRPADLVLTDLTGTLLRGTTPSSEMRMHVEVYARRPDVRAVVHAHPPHVLAFSVAGRSLGQCILPEVIFSLGRVAHAEYATPTTAEVPRVIAEHVAESNALILDRHGTLTLGESLEAAFNRLETLEHTARITWLARALGPIAALPEEEVARLRTLAAGIGLQRAYPDCSGCDVCPTE